MAIGSCLALAATACGGGDNGSEDEPVAAAPEATTGAAEETTTTTTAATAADEPAETTTTSTTTTTTTTTTTIPASTLPATTVTDLPDLVVTWGNGTGDPLDLAQRIIGFPLEVAPPGDTAPADLDLRLRTGDPSVWRWEWIYRAFSTPGSVQDIDTELPEGGPGTIEGRLYYDPLFESLGWRNVAQVISDPSSGGGGPQSVNWAYEDNDGVLVIGTLETEPTSARAWVDEDIGFGPTEGTPGHQIEINVLTPVGTVPVPVIDSLLTQLPAVDGSLRDLVFRTFTRSADSFGAEEGLRYLELDLEWSVSATSPDTAGEAYLAALPGTVLQEGEESFFDEGIIEVRPPLTGGFRDWTQSVILLDRYPGSISMDLEEDGSITATLELNLEPNREVLQRLAE